ncbi:hypothetical protein [Oricola sp.]|uniref:hypothetical protein n=1 Tax=Oricola sp. TaxID=1979950 RepID=UPI0025D35567|nr:hypothetical protein [Oricola sp.]MCI5078696.1 hypothetical protein [Oricola sp.]
MAEAIAVTALGGPIRVSVTSSEPVKARVLAAPVTIRALGTPGPKGDTGQQGLKGDKGDPGITLLPTDAPINGGFF